MQSLFSFLFKGHVVLCCACVSPVLAFTPSSFTKTSSLSPIISHVVDVYASSRSAGAPISSFSYPENAAPVLFSSTAAAVSPSNSASTLAQSANPGPRSISAAAPSFSYSRRRNTNSSPDRPLSLDSPSLLRSSPAEGSSWRKAGEISSLTSSTATPVFDIERIRQILPHRFPFLLVDKVLSFEAGKRAVGVKQVTANEDQFNGHFPTRSILPGVLQVEALAQLAGIIALQPPISDGKGDFFFAGVNGVRWKKPVTPGDTLVMEVELTTWKEKLGIAKAKGKAFVDGKPAVEIEEMIFALVRPS